MRHIDDDIRTKIGNEVKVPECVHQTVTSTIAMIQNESRRERIMKKRNNYSKYIKIAAAILCVAAVGITAAWGNQILSVKQKGSASQQLAEKMENMFVLTVNAQEMEPGIAISAIPEEGMAGSDGFQELESGALRYAFYNPVRCQGENIESITYSINKGWFEIVALPGEDYNITGTEIDKGTDLIGGFSSKLEKGEVHSYSTITIPYNVQDIPSDELSFKIVGEDFTDNYIWREPYITEEFAKRSNEVMNEFLEGVIMTCTVAFTDGTTEERQITMASELRDAREVYPDVPESEWGDGYCEVRVVTYKLL